MDSSSLAEAREESLFITLATYSPRDSCRDELHRFLKKVGGSELSKLPRLIISGVLEEAALIFGPKIMSFLKSSSSMCGEKPFVEATEVEAMVAAVDEFGPPPPPFICCADGMVMMLIPGGGVWLSSRSFLTCISWAVVVCTTLFPAGS